MPTTKKSIVATIFLTITILVILYEFPRKNGPIVAEDSDSAPDPELGPSDQGKSPESLSKISKQNVPMNSPLNIKNHIQEIEVIWNKSVLSQSDLQKKRDTLGNDQLLKALSLRLSSVSFTDDLIKEGKNPTTIFKFMQKIPFSTETMERQKYVKFFIQSVMWAENPIRSKVVEAMKHVILSNNINETDSEDQRKSIAGDKIELYLGLHKADPEAAERLLSESEGLTWKVLNYAHKKLNGPNSGILANIYK